MSRWTAPGIGLLVIGLLLPNALVAADVDRYLPDDAEMVVSINVKQILASKLIENHARKELERRLQAGVLPQLLQSLHFNLLTDITALIAAGPVGTPPNQGLLIVHGKFDVDEFTTRANKLADTESYIKVRKVGKLCYYEVAVPNTRETIFVAVLDHKTLVVSTVPKYLLEALEKRASGKSKGPSAEIRALIEKANEERSVWVVGIGAALGKLPIAEDETAKDIFSKMTSYNLGLTLHAGLKFEGTVTARDTGAAAVLKRRVEGGLDTAKSLAQLVVGSRPELAPLSEFLDSFKIAVRDGAVGLQGELSGEAIGKMLK